MFLTKKKFFLLFSNFKWAENVYSHTYKIRLDIDMILKPIWCMAQEWFKRLSASYGDTAWKVSKCEVSSGLYFPVFWLNTEIYG